VNCWAHANSTNQTFTNVRDNLEAEDLMRSASTGLGSLCGMCTNPVYGVEAKTLPKNSFSHGQLKLSTKIRKINNTFKLGQSAVPSQSLAL